jgi:hypothetical protein
MDKKGSMDSSQVAMLVTENESVYQTERMKDEFFQEPAGTSSMKEPNLPLVASGVYPRKYIEDMLKRAKANGSSHIIVKMSRKDKPIQIGFRSEDKLNPRQADQPEPLTYLWLAGRVDEENDDTLETINKAIEIYQNEVKKLVERQAELLKEAGKDAAQKAL